MIGCVEGWQQDTRKALHLSFYKRNQDVMKQRRNIFNDLIIHTSNRTFCFIITFSHYQCLTASNCSCLGDILSGISSYAIVSLFPQHTDLFFVSIFGTSICVRIHTSISFKSCIVFHYMFNSYSTLLLA